MVLFSGKDLKVSKTFCQSKNGRDLFLDSCISELVKTLDEDYITCVNSVLLVVVEGNIPLIFSLILYSLARDLIALTTSKTKS